MRLEARLFLAGAMIMGEIITSPVEARANQEGTPTEPPTEEVKYNRPIPAAPHFNQFGGEVTYPSYRPKIPVVVAELPNLGAALKYELLQEISCKPRIFELPVGGRILVATVYGSPFSKCPIDEWE